MKYQKECFLGCGTPGRPVDDLKTHCSLAEEYRYDLEPNGNIKDTEYWFCSIECFETNVLSPLIPNRYSFDKNVADDPDYDALFRRLKDDYDLEVATMTFIESLFSRMGSFNDWVRPQLDEFMLNWMRAQFKAIDTAHVKIVKRAQEEWEHQWDIDINKYMDEQDKRAAQLQKEADQAEEAFQKKYGEDERYKPKDFDL